MRLRRIRLWLFVFVFLALSGLLIWKYVFGGGFIGELNVSRGSWITVTENSIRQNAKRTEGPAVIPPTPGLDLQLRIVDASRDGKFTIEMWNTSEKAIRIWQTGNSWGEMNWRVFHVSKSGVETFFESPIQMFTKNTPGDVVVEPKSHITRKLDLNGGNWCGREHCSWWDEHGLGGKQVAFDPGDTVVVSYDVRPTEESFKLKVWIGVTAAVGTIR